MWFAVAPEGALHAPLNPALTGQRLSHALTVSDAAALVVDDVVLPDVAGVIAAQRRLQHVGDRRTSTKDVTEIQRIFEHN